MSTMAGIGKDEMVESIVVFFPPDDRVQWRRWYRGRTREYLRTRLAQVTANFDGFTWEERSASTLAVIEEVLLHHLGEVPIDAAARRQIARDIIMKLHLDAIVK